MKSANTIKITSPEPTNPRTVLRRVGVGVVGVSALACVGWMLWGRPAAVQPTELTGLGFPTAWATRDQLRESAAAAAAAAVPVLRMREGSSTATPLASCGLPSASGGDSTKVSSAKANSTASSAAASTVWTADRVASAAQARERLRQTLLLSSDEWARAAAYLLPQVAVAMVATPAAPEGNAVRTEPAELARQAEFAAQHELAREADAMARAEAMARLAQSSQSPRVYALAWKTCQMVGAARKAAVAGRGSACQLLSVAQWARLDPRNAAPWFEMAGEAYVRGDQAGVSEAMYRASQAQSVDLGFGHLASVAFTHSPRENTLFDAWMASGELTGWSVSWSLPAYRMASLHCEAKQVTDANHRQQCADLAELFVQRGTSLMDLAIAQSLGQHVGWSSQRLEALALEREALTALLWQKRPALAQSQADCTGLQRERDYVLAVAQHGELAVAREALRQSGRSTQDWANERRPQVARAAASAASGADAAASAAVERRMAAL